MQTMYEAIVNSPRTRLKKRISQSDSVIEVEDISAFPDPPNLATIGTDEDAETILYSAKTNTALSGCIRGIDGEVKVWEEGELIARNFTAYDHNTFLRNIGDIDVRIKNPITWEKMKIGL